MRFNEILLKSIRAAQNLQKRGYKKPQIFRFIANNSPEVAPIVFAALYMGCPLHTLDTSYGKIEMSHVLNFTKPTAIFCDANIYDLVRECLNELGWDAEIFTFGGRTGGSIPVEQLFVETSDEREFMQVATSFLQIIVEW